MKGLVADLRYALRLYRSTPLVSSIAVLVLAIAFIAAFLSLWSALVQPHPGFEDARDLVSVRQINGDQYRPISLELIERINAEMRSLDGIAGAAEGLVFISDGVMDDREPRRAELVTRRFFPLLRPHVQLGRGFDERDHQQAAEPAVILSHQLWQSRFGGRPNILGETITLRGQPSFFVAGPDGSIQEPPETIERYHVIGIAAPEFRGAFSGTIDLWLPYERAASLLVAPAAGARVFPTMYGIGRLTDRADPEAVTAELRGRYGNEGAELGVAPEFQLYAESGVFLDILAHHDALQQVRAFLAEGLLLVVVAASNVGLFLLSRAPGRRHELSIRMAVGAPLKRLARQMLTEGALLVAAAVLLGLIASVWLDAILRRSPFLATTEWRSTSPLNWRVLVMVAGLTLFVTALVSLAPLTGLKGLAVGASSREMTSSAGLGQKLAGTVQLSVSATIAAAALAFGWYLAALVSKDPGFNPHDVIVVTPGSNGPQASRGSPEAWTLRHERWRAVIGALPGVEAVAWGIPVPRGLIPTFRLVRPPGQIAPVRVANVTGDPAYPQVLGMTLVHGRAVQPGERNVVLINQTLARQFWGRSDVVGEVLTMVGPTGQVARGIVGVLKDASYGHPAEKIQPMIFFDEAVPFVELLVKTSISLTDFRQLLQHRIDGGELDLAIGEIHRLEDLRSDMLVPDRARTLITGVGTVLVVLLAAFGLFGTQRYLVSSGRREYAIRAAVGAGPKALGRLVMQRGLQLGLPGLAIGTLLAFIVVAWLRSDFVSMTVSPLAVALAVTLGNAALVLAAGIGPARQARATEAAPLLREQ